MFNLNIKIIFNKDRFKLVNKMGLTEDSIERLIPERIKDFFRKDNIKHEKIYSEIIHKNGIINKTHDLIIHITDISYEQKDHITSNILKTITDLNHVKYIKDIYIYGIIK